MTSMFSCFATFACFSSLVIRGRFSFFASAMNNALYMVILFFIAILNAVNK